MKQLNLLLVFLALFLGVAIGLITPPDSLAARIFDLFGQLFLNALKLVIVPLVVSSIITGIAKMGQEEHLASLSLKTFGIYFLITLVATGVGFCAVYTIEPGLHLEPMTYQITEPMQNIGEISTFERLGDLILKLFPSNIFQAAADAQMLGLIIFSLLFGYFTSKIDPHLSGTLQSFWKGVFQVMMKITQFIMIFLPFGAFFLIAKAVSLTGLEAVRSAGWFFATMLIAYFVYALIVLPLVLKFWAKVNPFKHIEAMWPALITAFTTSSSAATLPVTLECMEKRAGVSNRVSGFTLPLGTSFHLAGTAIFECVSVIFIAQAFGIPLSFADYGMVIILSFVLSIGIAGIPSASVVAVVMILTIMKLPMEGLAILFVVERLLDMFRTTINVFSNTVCTVLVARSEKEHTHLI